MALQLPVKQLRMTSLDRCPQVLADDSDSKPFIDAYARDQQRFFADFSAAYIKLTMLGTSWA